MRIGSEREGEGRRVEGTVLEARPNDMFSVRLDDGRHILGHMTGMARTRTIRVLPGDRVRVQLSPYDPGRGRILSRTR